VKAVNGVVPHFHELGDLLDIDHHVEMTAVFPDLDD
jgi:hypothetical protein